MAQGSDVKVASLAHSYYMVVELYVSVEDNAEALDGRRWRYCCIGSIHRGDLVCMRSLGNAELDDLRLGRAQCQAVVRQPVVQGASTTFNGLDSSCQLLFAGEDVQVCVIGVLVMS